MRGLVTGATGFIGQRLLASLDTATALSRDPDRASRGQPGTQFFRWDPDREPAPAAAFRGVDAVFHLAGEPVAGGRWTPERKARILDSRVHGTRHLVDGLAGLPRPPAVLVSASAVGYYGTRGDDPLDESAESGDDFLAGVCRAWEAEAARARELGIRVVHARIGVVLGPDGGALGAMLPFFRKGLGGPVADGTQWMPWIHVDDVVGILKFCAETPALDGPVNVVGPAPARNRDFTRALSEALDKPAVIPVPALGLRVAFGEMASVLTASQRVLPVAAVRAGYTFRHPLLADALRAAV